MEVYRELAAHICSRHSRQLCICIVCRSNLHDIRGDNIEAVEAPQNCTELTGRPTTRLRCARGWSERRVNRINLASFRKSIISASCLREGKGRKTTRFGRRTSMDRYTGLSPTVSRIFLMMPSVPARGERRGSNVSSKRNIPMVSISRASMRWKPDASSFE